METKEKKEQVNPWADFYKNQENYITPSLKKSIWQVINTFVPYVALWVAMAYSLKVSYWLTALLIVIASGFLVRLFIIFHDCGHGSFFKSEKANLIVGAFFGILAFTPYYKWHNSHIKHHATVGNLDKRGVGDVWTMTKEEYNKSSKKKRLFYKLYRLPIFMFGVGPLYVFLIQNRMTSDWMNEKEKRNVYFTNLMLVVLIVAMGLSIGFVPFILLQIAVMYLAGIAGLWLFYLQHQYEDVTWYRNKDWNFREVALAGSSYVKFPKILQWFSGNIGFHHIHHFNSRIPNYNLEKCHRENDIFQQVKPVTFLISMKSLKLRLWDEKLHKLVAYKH
ncbi:fatty acid desaturase [Prolixibacteraceae bacterium Z1-6]|uniref:Fatty acid desaturase n=1 Tax=Draconibacterium aestuarii TaxID=2998507 RepID=A0A9X3F4M8_9BACT|nr:fatty acid desaturase [Prolixibacteraceae bacterium Z1-6]